MKIIIKFLAIVFLFSSYIKTEAGIIHVGKNKPYTSVQKGIDATVTGDTVLVDPGHYKEHNITINKKIYVKNFI